MWLSILTIVLFFSYTGLILYYQSGWNRQRSFNSDIKPTAENLFFSIIIPARNEENHIANCLRSIIHQQYSGEFEIIVVDDFSTDRTCDIIRQLNHPSVKLIQLKDHFTEEGRIRAHKKTAIALAVNQAKGDWIITTDADCVAPPNWLQCYASFIRARKVSFIAAPVDFLPVKPPLLSVFQSLDFMSLQGISAAAASYRSHVLCNGANMAYKKKTFVALGGYEGIDQLPTGDDMLLMQKFYRAVPQEVYYMLLKDAIIKTYPADSWKGFLNQRIRWASKADQYGDPMIFFVLLLVYLFNLSFLALALWTIYDPPYIWLLICLLVCKTLLELYFLIPVARFFGKLHQLWWFPIAQPFHILYTIVSGFLGKFGSYQWKGRIITK